MSPAYLLIARFPGDTAIAGTGPRCTICDHPQRVEIDRALVVQKKSHRVVARQFSVSHDSVQRHKQNGHVAEALVLYETERQVGSLVVTGEIFHRNVERLSKAQDAVDRWLTDPERPEWYDIGARAEEVTVFYEETESDGEKLRTVRRRGKLQTLLGEIQERHGIRVTGFETKHADPRRLLTDYSEGLRGEIQLFVQAWEAYQAQEAAKQQRRQQVENEAEELRTVLETALAVTLAADIAEAMDGLLDAKTSERVANYCAPRLLERLIERLRGGCP